MFSADLRALSAIALLLLASAPARAFEADGCERQRKQYPAKWNDTSAEKTLFTCQSQRARFHVKIGATDEAGRTLMSLVPLSRTREGTPTETGSDVLRVWLDREQTRRLREGKYFATIVRQEESCWIRGSIDQDVIFVLDTARPPSDRPREAGEFYNKAPRFSVLGGAGYVNCEPAK